MRFLRRISRSAGWVGILLLCAGAAAAGAQAPGVASSLAEPAATPPADGAPPAQLALPLDPKLENQYTELAAKARTQDGAKQSETLAKLAELDVQLAEDGFAAHRPAAAAPHLEAAATLADRAMVSLRDESAHGKTNGIQNVEKSFQKITFLLKGLAQQVAFGQRATVETVHTHIANLRGQLLDMLFAPKKK